MNLSKIFLLTSSILTSASHAAPSLKILADIENVTPDDKTSYNPINGPIVLESGYLKNIRYFGHNGPNVNPKFHCIAQGRMIRTALTRNQIPNVCPQDYVTALVQWLFPDYLEHHNFVANNRVQQNDLVAFLTPLSIGKILNVMASSYKNLDQDIIAVLAQDIGIIAEHLLESQRQSSQDDIHKWQQRLPNSSLSDIDETYGSLSKVKKLLQGSLSSYLLLLNKKAILEKKLENQNLTFAQKSIYQDILNVHHQNIDRLDRQYKDETNTIKEILNILQGKGIIKTPLEAPSLWSTIKKYKRASKHLVWLNTPAAKQNILFQFSSQAAEFARTIKGALELVASPPEDSNEVYHPDVVTAALLAFAWDKATTKHDIVDMLEKMPNVVDPYALQAYATSDKVFDQRNYEELKQKMLEKQQLDTFFTVALAGLGYAAYEKKPQKIPYDWTRLPKVGKHEGSAYEDLIREGEAKTSFPDCGESSLRSIINFILYDPDHKVFNPEWLGVPRDNSMYQFYQDHSTVESAGTTEVREKWATLVARQKVLRNAYVTRIKGQKIPQCEINVGLSNILAVLGVLLGIEPENHGDKSTVNTSILDKFLKNVSDKSQAQWEWEIEDSLEGQGQIIPFHKEGDISLTFYRNCEKMFTWHILPWHFDITVYWKETKNWLSTYTNQVTPTPALPLYTPLLYDRSSMPKDLGQYISLQDLPDSSLLLYSSQLNTIDGQLDLLSLISEKRIFLSLGINLIQKLKDSEDDYATRKRIFENATRSYALTQALLNSWVLNANDIQICLTEAIKNNAVDVARILIEKGANIHKKDIYGYTPLMRAAQFSAVNMAKLLLKKGADIHEKDKVGNTPLAWAAQCNAVNMTKLLLKKGANIHERDKVGNTPLMKAFTAKAWNVAKILIEEGANIHERDNYDNTPLVRTAQYNAVNMAKLLIKNGANIHEKDKDGNTPLAWAIKCHAWDMAKLLIKNGTNIHEKDNDGNTSLMKAFTSKAWDVATLLLKKGANIDEKNSNGETLLIWAIRTCEVDGVKFLIEKGANIDEKDDYGNTPLMWAAQCNAVNVAELLIDKGANIEKKDDYGNTALMLAIQYKARDMAKLLADKKPTFMKRVKLRVQHYIRPLQRR